MAATQPRTASNMPPSATIAPEIQFANLSQQGETSQLGMWVFITTETLFFGALIFTYFLYRIFYSHDFDITRQRRSAVVRQHQYRPHHDQQPDDGAGHQCRGRRAAPGDDLVADRHCGPGYDVFSGSRDTNTISISATTSSRSVNLCLEAGRRTAGRVVLGVLLGSVPGCMRFI